MKYLLKVWLFTGIIAPTLFNLYYVFQSKEIFNFNSYVDGESAVILDLEYFTSLFFMGIIIGLLFTLPTILLLFLIKKYWTNNKIVFTIFSIISIFVSIYPFYDYFGEGLILFPVLYSIAITFFIWILKDNTQKL